MMNVRRRITKGLLAGAMIVGLVTPTFAAGTLTRNFESANVVDVVRVATSIGESAFGKPTTYVSAVQKIDQHLRIHAYHVNDAKEIIAANTYVGGIVSDVAIARVGGDGHVVVAMQDDGGKLRLLAVDVTSGSNNQEITRLGASAPLTSLAPDSKIAIVDASPLAARDFVTAVRNADGVMRLDSWSLSDDGTSFDHLDTEFVQNTIGNIAMESNYVNTSRRFATATQNTNGNMVLSTWNTSGTGAIMLEGSTTRGVIANFDLAFSSDRLYVVAHHSSGGGEVQRYEATQQGVFTHKAEGPLPTNARDAGIYDLGDGTAILTIRGADNQLAQWSVTQNGTSLNTSNKISMQHSAMNIDGVRSETSVFYAIQESGTNNLFHQLWTDN